MLVDRADGGGDEGGTRLGGRLRGCTSETFPAVSQRRKDLVMSVATQLGLADPEGDLLGQAREMWPTWCCLLYTSDAADE